MLILQVSLVCGYVACIVAGAVHPRAPAWFWTMLMPLLPALVVGIGFHTWRRLCPVACIAAAGARFWRGLRLPEALRPAFSAVPFGLLVLALVLRHAWMNGDGAALAGFLAAFAVLSLLVNLAFGGKTWCNHVCPVGFVERVYTDGAQRGLADSRCTTCTGCKSACPDIDQTRAFGRELWTRSRRLCVYAFPGVVWGFYWYFWLREGDFGAFFSGAWTASPASLERAFGAGLQFAPEVSVPLAACAAMLVSGALSACAFFGMELWLSARRCDRAQSLNLTQSLAAFLAFVTFYFFAGAPAIDDPLLAGPVRFGAAVVIALWVLQRRLLPALSQRPRVARPVHHLPVV